MDVLKKHYQPTPSRSIINQPPQLLLSDSNSMNQKEGESVAEYVAELKRLLTHCQFNDYLDDALRDHLVCRLQKESTQKHLLLEDKLTFTKAVDTAQNSRQANPRNEEWHC